MTPEEIEHQKVVEYYAASVNAWYSTSLEHDKNVLTLSAGGIGLLITLLTTVGLTSAEALVLYIGAITSFLVALISILFIFRRNQTYIEQVLTGNNTGTETVLAKADTIVLLAFGIGVVFTAVIGFATAIHSYTSKEKNMTTEDSKSTHPVFLTDTSIIDPTNIGLGIESFNGAAVLNKSFNNVVSLKPQNLASTPAACSPASPQNQSGTSTNKSDQTPLISIKQNPF
jgi:hypothetical protein